jgi:hypothetical protein
MNSDQSKHNDVPETQPSGEHAVALQESISLGTNRHLANLPQPSAAIPTSSATAEQQAKPAAMSPPKRARIAGAIILVLIIGGLTIGFLPRWRQSRFTLTDTTQLANPTV